MELEIVTDGLGFPEGPVWMLDGSVILTEIATGRITRVFPDGRKDLVADCGGGPNGAAIGPDGKLYVCNNGGMACELVDGLWVSGGEPTPGYKGGWIDRIDVDSGKIERIYDSCDGRRLSAPNDLVFDAEGGFWFSDMGKHEGHIIEAGGIYYAKADGSLIKRAIDGPRVNGVGLSPDGKTIYGGITLESLLLAFDITGPGEAGPGGFLGGHVVAQFKPRQLPDSLALTADGHVCQALVLNGPGIGSVDPATGKVTHIPFPDVMTTNICFGGADMRDAWITQSTTGRLVKTRWDKPGLRLAFYA